MNAKAVEKRTPFTAGPWRIELDADPQETLICETGSWFIAGPGQYEIETEEEDANARLIVAAPELYKAAKLACLNFERAADAGARMGDDEHESWTALEKAVAKAERGDA